jgi:hypothetical protein
MYFLQKYLPRVSFDLHSCPSWFEDREDGSSQGIQKFMIPKLTDYENDLFNKKLSLYFYYTANSFRNIECDLLFDALKVLRKDVRLDNRKKLGGNRLDSAYREVEEVIGTLSNPQFILSLIFLIPVRLPLNSSLERRERWIESICSYNKAGQDEADEVYSEYLKYTIFVQDMPMKIPRLHSSLSTRKYLFLISGREEGRNFLDSRN